MCKVIAVTSRKLCRSDFLEQIELLVRAGVDEIVLREKDLTAKEYMNLAQSVQKKCNSSNTLCALHKNISVAKKLKAEAIHLSLPFAMENRQQLKKFQCVGVSTHSIEQVQVAQACNVDYIFYGHVFETDCKKGLPPRGLKQLETICKEAMIPVYAIGGICPENAKLAVEAGAAGVCVMSWSMEASYEQMQAFVQLCHSL